VALKKSSIPPGYSRAEQSFMMRSTDCTSPQSQFGGLSLSFHLYKSWLHRPLPVRMRLRGTHNSRGSSTPGCGVEGQLTSRSPRLAGGFRDIRFAARSGCWCKTKILLIHYYLKNGLQITIRHTILRVSALVNSNLLLFNA